MTVWREVQEALYARFIDQWKVGAEPRTPIQLDNEKFDPPDGPWVKLVTQRRAGGPGTMGRPGNRKMDRAGAVFVLLREPPGDGVGRLSDLADQAAAVFENCRLQPHDIRFSTVEPGLASQIENGRWWGVAVEGRFQYEELK